MPTKRSVFLVRHGETEWNREGRFQGQSDIPLSDVGREQARALRARLSAIAERASLFDGAETAVVSSDLSRAVETATLGFGVPGREHQVDAALREFRYGIFEGLTRADIDTRFPGQMLTWSRGNRHYAMDGGESRAHVFTRAHAAVTRALAAFPHRQLVVVAHGGVIRQLLFACFGDEALMAEQNLNYANAATHLIEVDGANWAYDREL